MGIYKYKFKDKYIVLDVNSSLVYDVDQMTYDVLDYYKNKSEDEITDILKSKYDENEIKEVIGEIKELENENRLYTPEKKVNRKLYEKGIVKAMCLHVSHDCNLACRYCFASGGNFNMKKEVMNIETAKKAIDFIINNSGNKVHLEVDFFGGEPLLNFDVVKETVEYAKEEAKKHGKIFRFTLTTNCVLLNDEIIDYINKEMYNVVLSIDGRKEINDYTRPTANGKGSYDLIIENIKKVAKSRDALGLDYYIRGTYTKHNLDFYKDVEHFSDLGLKQLSLESVVADEHEDYAITKEDLPTIMESYDKLTDIYLSRLGTDKEFRFFHFNVDLDGGKCEYKRVSGCGAGCEYVAVTPFGDIYPCHQFVGNTDFVMGNLNDGITNENIRNDFYSSNSVLDKKECEDCFCKYFCGGGCHANSYNFNGNINGIYEVGCDILRKRIECAIYIKCKEKDLVD